MRRALRWAGVVVGGSILFFGLSGLLGSADQPPADQQYAVIGSILIMIVGAAIFAPSLFFLLRAQRRGLAPLPTWSSGLLPAAPPVAASGLAAPQTYAPAPDLKALYRQWLGWCESELGGDAIALNSAAIAALGAAARGDSSAAQTRAREAWTRSTAERPPTARPAKLSRGKRKVLAGVGTALVPLLEPGERVQATVYGTNQSAQVGFGLALGWIGQLIAMTQQSTYYLVLTDGRLLGLTSSQYSRQPQKVAFLFQRSAVEEIRVRRYLFGTRRVRIRWGQRTLNLLTGRQWRPEAELAQQLTGRAAQGG